MVADSLAATAGGVAEPELHMFCYLACLLALYDGREPSWWDYEFTATKVGAPYSKTLDDAKQLLAATGLLRTDEELLAITEQGRLDKKLFMSFQTYAPRVKYLMAACNVSLAFPLASMGPALAHEPQLRAAMKLVQTRTLLDEAGLALLRPHFNALQKILAYPGEDAADRDLSVPAVIWLTYLAREIKSGLPDD